MKVILKLIVALAIIGVVGFFVLLTNLNTLITNAVNTAGPMIMKVDVFLEESKVSLLSGSGELKKLKVGNPYGFKTEHLFNLDNIAIELNPSSLASDTAHIKKVHIDGPHVIFEGDPLKNNIKSLIDGLSDDSPSAPEEEQESDEDEKAPAKEQKIIIDHLVIENVKLGVSHPLLQGKALNVTLPRIELRDLGKEEGGATPADVVKSIMKEFYRVVLPAIQNTLGDVGNVGKEVGKLGDKLKKGIDDKIKDEKIKYELKKATDKAADKLKNFFK